MTLFHLCGMLIHSSSSAFVDGCLGNAEYHRLKAIKVVAAGHAGQVGSADSALPSQTYLSI
jgi:hypothetical protein